MKVQMNVLNTPRASQLGQAKPAGHDFQSHLREALNEVNILQQEGDVALAQLLTGDIEFHDAMIIAEKANLALQLTMAIRTKLLEAYQEIMRMQV
ncbi:MAG: flagellar hook-basal body complex protein FliE [Firmicutes bacterium]|nr:flagellar hook-basal body complex protein FliE [Bacillota bacterium]